MLASAELYRLDKIPSNIKPATFDRGRSAALQIQAEGDEFGCSATIISNQGHVLTALHCLAQCVKFTEGKSVKSFRFTMPDQQQIRSGKANCKLPFAQEGKKFGSLAVQVVAAGAGYVFATDTENLKKELDKNPDRRAAFSQLIEAGVGITGDYAILRVPGLAGRTCAKTSARTASVNESVWNIGYPDTRSGAVFSPGRVSFAPVGKVDSTVTSGQQGANLVMRRTGALITSIEAHPGSSGSGVVSYQGDLVGLVNAAGTKAGSSSFGSSISYIVSTATVNYGSAVVASAFNCQ